MENDKDLNTAFNSWLAGCQKMIAEHFAKHLTNLTPDVLTVEKGSKYWRVVTNRFGDTTNRSVYCFIDSRNGDILKSESWKRPAKTARGNILDSSNGLAQMTVYGAAYLR